MKMKLATVMFACAMALGGCSLHTASKEQLQLYVPEELLVPPAKFKTLKSVEPVPFDAPKPFWYTR